MPRRAERLPAREEGLVRRIRATVPAHSKPRCCAEPCFLEFATLIETPSPKRLKWRRDNRGPTLSILG